jgi:hypothetical protein
MVTLLVLVFCELRMVIAATLISGLAFVTIQAIALISGLALIPEGACGVRSDPFFQLFDFQLNFHVFIHMFHLLSLNDFSDKKASYRAAATLHDASDPG